MVEGVEKGFEKEIRVSRCWIQKLNQGQKLDISAGYSHNIVFEIPSEVKLETVSEKGQPPVVILKSIDKQLIGALAAKIRSIRKPEPYKGKGIRYEGEYIRRKSRVKQLQVKI